MNRRNRNRDLKGHLKKMHADRSHGTPSTKQCRIIAAKYNSNVLCRAANTLIQPDTEVLEHTRYLEESARIVKESVCQSPSWGDRQEELRQITHHIDKALTLLLDMEDTRYILDEDVAQFHRLAPNMHAPTSFFGTSWLH